MRVFDVDPPRESGIPPVAAESGIAPDGEASAFSAGGADGFLLPIPFFLKKSDTCDVVGYMAAAQVSGSTRRLH